MSYSNNIKRTLVPTPFEIHITVRLGSNPITDFIQACKAIKVKPIILELQLMQERTLQDVMTSSVHIGSNTSAFAETCLISRELQARGLEVVRQKIETVPTHPSAPQHRDDTMPEDCYFESHIAVQMTDNNQEYVQALANSCNAKLSRNAIKISDNGVQTVMITKRSTGCFEQFEQEIKDLEYMLSNNNIEHGKITCEFAIYDTNIKHDSIWFDNTEENT